MVENILQRPDGDTDSCIAAVETSQAWPGTTADTASASARHNRRKGDHLSSVWCVLLQPCSTAGCEVSGMQELQITGQAAAPLNQSIN